MNKALLKSIALIPAVMPFAVSAEPVLEMVIKGKDVELKWPAAYDDWYVLSTTTLEPDSWGPLFQQPVKMGGNFILTYPVQANGRFFRLAQTDAPEGTYSDENGDGIDGDIHRAIFVTTNGNDNNPGTMAQPMATLPAAISKAASKKKDVYVGKGNYPQSSLLVLSSGVSLYGQFDPGNNWKRSAANITTISGSMTAVIAQSISEETHVEGFTIKSANATSPGASSYGVRVLSSSGPIFLRHNHIIAGNGAAGNTGNNGVKGKDGGGGTWGGEGYIDDENLSGSGGFGGSSPVGRKGGAGGKGGLAPSYWGAAGSAGTGGAKGGPGGGPGDPSQEGGDGAHGANGVTAPAGASGSAYGTLGPGGYIPGSGESGTAGTHGHGGGGGGGGGGQDCTFCDNGGGNGGGGGGGGGEGGTGGTGGGGGGGSFGILTYNSNVTISQTTLTTGTGGAGGKGGNGGTGGAGGPRGWGGIEGILEDELGGGGNGGNGGAGGTGGNGGGGGGGPSVGIARSGGTAQYSGITYVIGAGGAGGAGGSNGNPSNAGSKGVSDQVR